MLEPAFRLSYILVLQTVRMLSLSNAVPDTQLVIKGRHYELSFYLLTRLPDHLLVADYKSPTTQQRSTPGDEVAHVAGTAASSEVPGQLKRAIK